MVPSFGMIFQALLLAGAIWLVIKMCGRFPDDLAGLRKKYRDYKAGGDPEILGGMRSEERRQHYRETCVLEFRSEAITLGLLWALTFFAGLYAIVEAVVIGRAIVSGISALSR